MKTTIAATLLSLSVGLSGTATAGNRTVEVEITNLTNATLFTPLLVATHKGNFHLFQAGTPASGSVQAMAEGGALAGLIEEVMATGGNYVEDPAGGLLPPGESVTTTMEMSQHTRHLSVTAMLLPTNDGFVGLDGVHLPYRRGVYTYYLDAYDAGTEANDERITGGDAPGAAGIPADPGGNAGSGGTGVAGPDQNSNVHPHRGVVGDLDPIGGPSDLVAGTHGWSNPVAKVTVIVGGPAHH